MKQKIEEQKFVKLEFLVEEKTNLNEFVKKLKESRVRNEWKELFTSN